MATCPSCSAMIEGAALECWHCGAEVQRQELGLASAGGAPTLAMAEDDIAVTWTRSQRAMLGREILGQYVIVDKLGEGGMGDVYLADQPAIGRQVAIKIVHPPTRASEQDEHVERFRNEAKAAARLESPHIVQIFNWGELDDGTLFMAMEYLSGQTLAERLFEVRRLEPEVAVDIAEQVCAALTEAHGAGIVHRDLKPSNIMLGTRGDRVNFAKVLDFGVAKLEGSDITRSGAMFGTPQYMAPEQLRGEPLDGRSDLYSLGVLLYEMLAGVLPFRSPTAVGFVTAHLHDPPPPLPSTVPSELAEVVMMLLAKHPRERPPTAEAVTRELRAALGGRSPAARRRVRRRALRRALVVGAVATVVLGLSVATWQVGRWRLDTQAELDRERARGAELERRVRETEAAVAEAREEARLDALQVRRASDEVREQRVEVQRSRRPKRLDPAKAAMLGRTQRQLETELQRVFDGHRVPPSEVADVWKTHATRVQAVAAGELDEADLREQLVSMIDLYRKGFAAKRPGDRLPLDRLERLFLTMRTVEGLDADQRQAMLDAIYDEYDHDETLPEIDRAYYKRLAVAELIRAHGADAGTTAQIDGNPGDNPGDADPAPIPVDPGLDDEATSGPIEAEPSAPEPAAPNKPPGKPPSKPPTKPESQPSPDAAPDDAAPLPPLPAPDP